MCFGYIAIRLVVFRLLPFLFAEDIVVPHAGRLDFVGLWQNKEARDIICADRKKHKW